MKNFLLRYREYLMASPSWYKIIFIFFLLLVFILVTSLVGLMSAMAVYRIGLPEVLTAVEYPSINNIHIIKYLQVVQTIGIFIIPALIIAYFLDHSPLMYLNIRRKPSVISLILVVLIMTGLIPVINFAAGLNARLDLPGSLDTLEKKMATLRDNYNELTSLFMKSSRPSDFLINIFMMAILPALGEELLFRGVLQRIFAEWSKSTHWGIVISALLFSFFHFEFFGFLPRFLLGALFGYLFIWTSNLWIPVTGHLINNLLIVGYFYFMWDETGISPLETVGAKADVYFFLSLSGVIILLGLLYYNEKSGFFRKV